jgi:hypothetical protein
MTTISRRIALSAALALLASTAVAAGPPGGPLTKCPADSVVSGTVHGQVRGERVVHSERDDRQ